MLSRCSLECCFFLRNNEYTNDTGYLPDGTPLSSAGNKINHPERNQPEPPVQAYSAQGGASRERTGGGGCWARGGGRRETGCQGNAAFCDTDG